MQREHRAPSVFWLERNPSGTGERRSEGLRGAEEESILPNSHASWKKEGKNTEEGESARLSWEEELDGAQNIRSAVR